MAETFFYFDPIDLQLLLYSDAIPTNVKPEVINISVIFLGYIMFITHTSRNNNNKVVLLTMWSVIKYRLKKIPPQSLSKTISFKYFKLKQHGHNNNNNNSNNNNNNNNQ